MLNIGVKELLEAGVHFGHQTKRWNPKMKKFIFDARHGIHIIDLNQTITQIEQACGFLSEKVRGGGEVLFVGTKKQAQAAVRETAQALKQPYITQRWLGGALTNFNTVKRSIERLNKLEKMESDGSMSQYVKQEQSALRREAARLRRNLDGMRTMQRYPAAMFIVDLKREHNAVAEARRLEIPIAGIVDTNCDPTLVDYPIAANDDGIRSVRVILDEIARVIGEARTEFEAKSARSPESGDVKEEMVGEAESEAVASEPAPSAPVPPESQSESEPAEGSSSRSEGLAAPTEIGGALSSEEHPSRAEASDSESESRTDAGEPSESFASREESS